MALDTRRADRAKLQKARDRRGGLLTDLEAIERVLDYHIALCRDVGVDQLRVIQSRLDRVMDTFRRDPLRRPP